MKRNRFNEAEEKTGKLLLSDFQKSGIHLPASIRSRFVQVSDEINQLGQMFMTLPPRSSYIDFHEYDLQGVPVHVIKRFSTNGKVRVGVPSSLADLVLKYARDKAIRKRLYDVLNDRNEEGVQILSVLLAKRFELASVVGRTSYAEYSLLDKMAKSPGN